jgi:hypothetical protein
MSYTFQSVHSIKGSLPEVWDRILHARTFVVSPRHSLKVQLLPDAELRSGESVFAKLAVGPLVLPEAWVVQTHDRDNRRMILRGAEGFEDRLLWDHEVLVGEAGSRCIIDYRVKLPGRRPIMRFGIGPRHVFERRHRSLCTMLESARRLRVADDPISTKAA